MNDTSKFVVETLGQFRQIPGMVQAAGIRASLVTGGEIDVSGVAEVLKYERVKKKGTGMTSGLSSTAVTRHIKLLNKQRTMTAEAFVTFRNSLDPKHLIGVNPVNEYVRCAMGRLSAFIDENIDLAKTKQEKATIEASQATLDNLRQLIVDRGGKRSSSSTMNDEDFDNFD